MVEYFHRLGAVPAWGLAWLRMEIGGGRNTYEMVEMLEVWLDFREPSR
jgi:hypothetical protein